MMEYKRKYRLLFKTITIVLVCLFIVNNIAFAASAPYASSKVATLATPTEIPDSEFRAKFKVMENLLAHDAVNNYIKTQIEKEKVILDKDWERQKARALDISDPAIRGSIRYNVNGLSSVMLISVTGLLSRTGQVAHVESSGKDYSGVTVIYIDSQLFNDPQSAIQKHGTDEILQWENLRVNILRIEDKIGMRKWIKEHIDSSDKQLNNTEYEGKNARQIAKIFHERAYPLNSLYKEYADATDFNYEYINLMLSLYGVDERSGDVNIAAQRPFSKDELPWSDVNMEDYLSRIVSKRNWNEQVVLLEKGFKDKDALTALKVLLAILRSSDNIKFLNMAEKMRLFSKALSLAITGQAGEERKKMLQMLSAELLEAPGQFDPEAVLLTMSYINIATADVKKGASISTVIPFYGEQDAILVKSDDSTNRREHYVGDDDFLRTRIEQLRDLYAVNENFYWELILVGDGDDRSPDDVVRQEKTADIACRIAEMEYGDLYRKGRIRILELSSEEKKEIGSRKGGAVCLGMRNAIDNGADYVFFMDAVSSYHAGQAGLLLKELLTGADMAVGSRELSGSVNKSPWLRRIESFIYRSYARFMLPWVRSISDTQAGFKAFTRAGLEDIIPANKAGVFDRDFDYGLSFDTNLISRCKTLGKVVKEVPIVCVNFENRISKANSLRNIWRMIWGVIKQRLFFIKRFKSAIEKQRRLAAIEYLKPSEENIQKAKNFLSYYAGLSWRAELQRILGGLSGWKETADFAIALSSKEVVDDILKDKGISDSEYENIVSKAFSLALRPRPDTDERKFIRGALSPLSESHPAIRSEAQKTAKSYINIFDLKEKINVTTLFSMYGEQIRIRPAAEGGEDFLRIKIEQLEDLSSVNKDNFKWELVIVNDGDDRWKDPSPENKHTSLEMAREISREEYADYVRNKQINFFQMPNEMREEMKSRKGGAIMYGIWNRLRQNAESGSYRPDIFILTDADRTIPLSFEGLLIPSVLDGSVGMAIGSAQKDVSDVRRVSGLRQKIYKFYNKLVQFRLRELRGIEDTMMGFKAARSSILEIILPFSMSLGSAVYPQIDPTFVPRASFDEDMLSRIVAAGFGIREIPVTWIHSEKSSFGFEDKAESFYDSLWKVPKDISQWRKRRIDDTEKWITNNNDYQRRRFIDDMVGSSADSDKAAMFLLLLLGTDVYKRRSISKYLDKERSKAQGHLTKQERVGLLSHAISLFLRGSNGRAGYDVNRLRWLRSILKEGRIELLSESRILMESYIDICSARKKRVAMVSHLFASRRKTISDRLEQMQDIVFINPEIDWSFYWVTQTDAEPGYAGSMREAKDAISMADPVIKDRIHIIEVPHEELSRIESVKGGSLVIGMAESLKNNPDYVLCSDMSLVPNLAQSGAIIGSLVRNSDNLAIASRRLPKSVGRRVWFRRMFSYALNKWIWLHHQNLRVINDSQAGLKGFTAQQLKSILPIRIDDKGNRIYDYTFDYGLSADVALMAKAVKHGYGITEVPIIDTFEMSPKLTDHPLPKLYGKRVKKEIAVQAKAAEDFDGTWQFLGQGGEYQTFSHPSLDVVLQVPRRTNGFVLAFLTSGGDIAETMDKSTAMKVASVLLKTGPTQAFFYWYLHHSIRKNHSEERKRLAQIHDKLGGLVVPFDIVENPAINVFYSYKHAFFVSLKHFISWMTYPVRWIARRAARFIVERFFVIQKSVPESVFKVLSALVRAPIHALVWALRTFYDWIASALRGLAKIWPFRPLITFIRNFLKLDRPGIFLIYPAKFFRWLNKWRVNISNFITEKAGFIPDHVSAVSNTIKAADMATRPLWKNVFKVTDTVKRLIRISMKPERLEPEFALIKERIVSFGDVLLRLDRDKVGRVKNLKEAEELIERFIEFQKSLWTRGAFDYESHLLGDIGIDAGGNIVISDLGVITFDLDEALQKLRPENKGRDFMTQEVLRQALSSELYDYYINRMKEEVAEEKIRKLWRADVDSCRAVSPPVGIQGNLFTAVAEEEKVARLYEKLIKMAKAHNDERASEYLDSSDDKTVIATKVILRALRKGGWEERKIATEIAETVGKILSLSPYIKAQIIQNSLVNWDEAFDEFLKGTPAKILLDRFFKASLISQTALESIFINAILNEYFKTGIVDENKVNSVLQKYGQRSRGSLSVFGSRTDTFNSTVSYAEHAQDGVKLHEAPNMRSIDAYIVNAGEGRRQGVLGIQAGAKGDIVFLGRRMKEWSARSSQNMSRVIGDKDRRPVLFSPTDVIYLKPRGDERAHLEDTLISDKPVIFFSPQDKVLKSDLSRPFFEDVGELAMEALLEIPGIGRKVVHKLIIPYLRNMERDDLTENHGGYDFPGSWVVQPGRLMEAVDLFGYGSEKMRVAWWVGMRLPLRLRERLWANMREELSAGFTEEEWMARRNKVRDFVIESGGAHAKTLVHPWIDCNTPLDIFNIYRGVVSRSDLSWRRRLRETFEIEENADIIDSQINGDYESRGNFFINNSRIVIAPGVTLELGNDVVIDSSLIEITGNPGDGVVIPDGTVIAYSNISGQVADFAGSGRENFLHGVYSKNGFSFTGDKLVSATVILKSDEGPRTISQEFEFTSSGNVSLPEKEEIDLSRTEEIINLNDLLGPVRNKAPPAPEPAQKPAIPAENVPLINIISPDNLPEGVTTVTGGTGFIASNLCEALTEDGILVAATVRSGSTNFLNLPQNSNLNPVEFDLNNPDHNNLSTLVKRSKVVYHLSALGNQALATDLPAEAYVSNALTTGILAALCDQFDKRLLFSSTFVVYDFGALKEGEEADEDMVLPDPRKYPIHARWLDEAEAAFDRYVSDFIANKGRMDKTPLEFVSEHLLKNPLPPADHRMLGQNYPLSKLLAERLVLKRRNGIVMRVNNVYGSKQPEETMVPFFIKGIIAARDGSTFTVWPTKRDIVYVRDLIKVMRRLEDASVPPDRRIVNMASGNFVSAQELADTVKDILGIEDKQDWTGEGVKIRTDKKKRKDLMPSLRLSDKRIRGLIGPVDFTPSRDGLRATTEYYLSKNLAGCTPEHLLEVLKEEFKGGPATTYQIVGRKRYPKAAVLRALRILEEKGLIGVHLDRGINVYNVGSVPSGEETISSTKTNLGSHGSEGLPNDIYTPELKDAIDKGNILPVAYDGDIAEPMELAPDIENALSIMNKLIPAELKKGKVYEIRYDSARLREYQRRTGISEEFSPEALLKTYIQCLQMRAPYKDPKEAIKLIECPTRGDKEQGLISVTCYQDGSKTQVIGEGHVNIKGDLQGQELRIIAMLNMALTASNVPNSPNEISEYNQFIDIIEAQYKEITGRELCQDETGKKLSPEELLQAIRLIELPSAARIPLEKTEEYYRLAITKLQQAA